MEKELNTTNINYTYLTEENKKLEINLLIAKKDLEEKIKEFENKKETTIQSMQKMQIEDDNSGSSQELLIKSLNKIIEESKNIYN
jgi:hypothetical protein